MKYTELCNDCFWNGQCIDQAHDRAEYCGRTNQEEEVNQ